MVRDKVSLIYFPLIVAVYYAIHEAQFNLFFLGYHGFKVPVALNFVWYAEIAADIAVCSITAAILIESQKWRERILRSGFSIRLAVFLWIAIVLFYFAWMAIGFPVSVNVFDLKDYTTTNVSLTANSMEFIENVLYTLAFYFTFRFSFRIRRNTTELEEKTLQTQGRSTMRHARQGRSAPVVEHRDTLN